METADPNTADLVATTSDLSFIDTTARPGATYWYFLRTIDSSGNLSWRTGQRSATTPMTDGSRS
ncbi:MAG: hypothetical protein R2706_02360 [Acidimicrobiales bacterium]